MTTFSDIYELLETVRQYKLRPRERLVVTTSVTGSVMGYATADNGEPSIEWDIELRAAKETALARGTKEGERIRELLSSYMGRKQLLEELREGTLEYGLARAPEPEAQSEPEPEQGPRQCFIPGL